MDDDDMKIEFHTKEKYVDLSDDNIIDTTLTLGTEPCGFDDGVLRYKRTNERHVKIVSSEYLDIPIGQKGDLYIYSDENSGDIWRLFCYMQNYDTNKSEFKYLFKEWHDNQIELLQKEIA